MKIVTYNVENLIPGRCSEVKIQKLARVIREIDADILLLQEVGDDGLLKQIAPEYSQYFLGKVDGRGIGSAVASRIPITTESLSVDYTLSRFATVEALGNLVTHPGRGIDRISLTYNNNPLTIYNIHLRSNSPMSLYDSDGTRLDFQSHAMVAEGRFRTGIQKLAQALFLRKILDQHFVHDEHAQVIVIGDSNEQSWSLIHKSISGDLDYYNGAGLLWNANEAIPVQDRFSHMNATGQERMLDVAFVSESLRANFVSAKVYSNIVKNDYDSDQRASDHVPYEIILV